MTWGYIAAAVILTVGSAVASHDVEVKKNRAIGDVQAQAREAQEALESDTASVQADFEADKERRRQNLRRINPTGAGGVDDSASPLRRQAPTAAAGAQPSASKGRGRLLGS